MRMPARRADFSVRCQPRVQYAGYFVPNGKFESHLVVKNRRSDGNRVGLRTSAMFQMEVFARRRALDNQTTEALPPDIPIFTDLLHQAGYDVAMV